MTNKYLIVGLGNPGKTYDRTRHNIGFAAVDLLARKLGVEFRNSSKMEGALAQGTLANEPCLLLKPKTFMNLSGQSVAQVMKYHEIDLSRVLVIVDDVDLPLGQMRLRIESGPGSHNGLKSVEEYLQTNRYARLRLGVGDREVGDLSSHVLGKFTGEEQKLVEALLERAAEAVEVFINKGLTRAMDFANRKI
jgi:PTH1 family peptidyl-tRNA hydrolase